MLLWNGVTYKMRFLFMYWFQVLQTVTMICPSVCSVISRRSQVDCGLRALYCSLRLLKYKTMACQNFVLFQGETRPWNEGIIQIYKLSTLEVQRSVLNICFLSSFSWKRTSNNKKHVAKLPTDIGVKYLALRLWVDETSTFVQMSPETVEESPFRSVLRLLSSL